MVDILTSNKNEEERSFMPALLIGMGCMYFKMKDSIDWSITGSIIGFIVVGVIASLGLFAFMGLFKTKGR